MALIHAANLDTWASTTVARDNLGELLRRLIHAHIDLPEINDMRFLSHESNQLAGWDGILDCKSKAPWIPSGTSVWEIGTGNNIRQKIRTDFDNRRAKELPVNWVREQTSYVAVTLRKLDNVSDLQVELAANSPWSDIKIIDAQTFEEWIEISPTVETWLQEQGVGPPPSVRTLFTFWKEWAEKTQPPVSGKLILAGRDDVRSALRSNLASPGAPINIQADSPDEAVAYIYSSIESSEDLRSRDHFLARSVVIMQLNDTYQFRRPSPSQNIILCPPATTEALALSRYGHTVINALGNSFLGQKIDVRVNRPLRSDFSAALVTMGMSQEEAGVEARACGSSPSIWRIWNLINLGDPGDDIPGWANQEHADLVVPAILLGGWSENAQGDKEVIESITGISFAEYQDRLNPFITGDNPLLIKAGDAWVISAPPAAFALTDRYITRGQLEKLSAAMKTVFSEVDPTINLPPSERQYAGIRGVQLRHSTWLRDGLASSLLCIGVIGRHLEQNGAIPDGANCQSYVDSIVKGLPGLREDWRLFASLRDQLPVLAEASSIPFVEALESLLQGEPEKLRPLFDEGKGIFAHAFHPGLLWALETLAWEPTYLGRATIILGRLAEIDPGGTLANRPLNSLREIFLAWHPGTSANLDQRLQALDLFLDRFDDIGWELLGTILPKSHDVASPTHEPLWKDFGRSQREVLTNGIMHAGYRNYIERAIHHARMRPDRWTTLINICDSIPNQQQKLVEEGLYELSKCQLSQEERQMIWEELRHFINRHRAYADASWSLPEERLKSLGAAMEWFSTGVLLDQIAWLFNEDFPDLPHPSTDYEAQRKELTELRNEATKKVWETGGTNLISQLVNRVSYAGLVAVHLLESLGSESEVITVIENTIRGTDNEKFFVRWLSESAYKRFGNGWTQTLLTKSKQLSWSSEELVNTILGYPDSQDTFALVDSLGVDIEQLYWTQRPGWLSCKDDPSLTYAINKLKRWGRALEALLIVARKRYIMDSTITFELLQKALDELNKGKAENVLANDSYWINELFEQLRLQENIDRGELARWEYAYLPLLTGSTHKSDLALHTILSRDPDFFVRVLKDLYRPASKTGEEFEPSKEERLRAEFAWKLLRSWHKPPGIDEHDEVNNDQLREWVNKARKLATAAELVDVADTEIGKVLFYFPSDPKDSLWPHVQLRELIEILQSENVERGIQVEQFNSRGVVKKEMFEGGVQERILAKKWQDIAGQIRFRWPRTAAMCERMGVDWESDAKREDERAEKQRLQYG